MQEREGYRTFRDTFHDALLLGNGLIKHWWDKTPEYKVDDYTGLSEAEYLYVTQQSDVESVDKVKTYEDPDFIAPELSPELTQAAAMGDPNAIAAVEQLTAVSMLYDFTVRRVISKGRLMIATIPDEELLLDRSATVIDEDVRFIAHVTRVTRSDLVKEGFDKEKVAGIPTYEIPLDRKDDRESIDFQGFEHDRAPDAATEYVQRFECYILMDYNGDGMAERRRVIMAGSGNGGVVLSNEEWGDDLPFSDIVPDPRPHVWKGNNLYDKIGDIQRIKSVGIRAIIDNTYEVMNPQRDVAIGAYENMDEVVDRTLGGVLLRKAGAEPIKDYVVTSIAPQVMPILDCFDSVNEKRTGISQRTAALDMDALQNQSATAVNAAMSAVQSIVEEYARNIAECGGLKRAFRCFLRLIVKHQDDAKMIRLRGKLVNLDPRAWDADMHVTINTGLGTGARDKDAQMLGMIAGKQEMLIAQFGPFNDKLNIGHLMMTYQKMAEAVGVKNADAFFPTITQEDVAQIRQQQEQQAGQQGQQNPQLMAEQARIQAMQARDTAKAELDRQKAMEKAQLDREKASANLDLQRQKAELSAQLERERMALQAQNKEFLAQLDARLKEREMMLEMQLTQQANEMKMMFTRSADVNLQEQNV
jgi:hypothetical protein